MASHNPFDRLSDNIKHRIFQLVSREGVFAYNIATGGRESDRSYIKENAFYEPFTYWDWHETYETYTQPDKRKRRLFWENERGYRANGSWPTYPNPLARWEQFQASINDDNRYRVKRIALASWMKLRDLAWVAKELPALEALDLSDLYTGFGDLHPHSEEPILDGRGIPKWRDIGAILGSTTPRSPRGAEHMPLLGRLKWLGIPHDFRNPTGEDAFSSILQYCRRLETISIRAPPGYDSYYWSDRSIEGEMDPHQKVCVPLARILDKIPRSVTKLELRQYFGFLKILMPALARNTNIERVGLDLGAWCQVDPFRQARDTPNRCDTVMDEKEIRKDVEDAVNRAFEIAKQPKKPRTLTESPEAALSRASADSGLEREAKDVKALVDQQHMDRTYKDARNTIYTDRGGTILSKDRSNSAHHSPSNYDSASHLQTCFHSEDNHNLLCAQLDTHIASTLPTMLRNLYSFKKNEAEDLPTLYQLEPEAQQRGCDPLNPLSLIQNEKEVDWETAALYYDSNEDDPVAIYRYLHQTFKWRPVFDWDTFMVPGQIESSEDPAFVKMLGDLQSVMDRLRKLFEDLRKAGVPVHLLIRRPSPSFDRTSLHQAALAAAYAREAVGWHRFWATYALEFENLTKLRLRMPAAFDEVAGSARLAKLLEGPGWRQLVYMDERQRMQTEEDLSPTIARYGKEVFEHLPESMEVDTGRFVRRTWFWTRPKAKRTFSEHDTVSTAMTEEQEFQRALEKAREASDLEYEIEAGLIQGEM
ncbi:hypothetical protein M011DRAFT_473741 [Sporormia fimetaria CBS 119925]|uniref:Uncharacterized protein n=1 Tax=Sporormia fimetaria CBS 119925 TaxID=1340428 RepID=A0A6A6VNA3_9PLEO|nr:hypothetical protein M011DRAFT_473741 [Sporormia fimetaria CBS 119925]